ncbi:unnamed protein product [Nippostrongylus brasiliensis]|uniref:Secreted protein n=1 Tax=Nippostrongylus brasiliensis TaxID=27835 RepID=A0A0N4YTI7_NIPBR|nr:unnamed protein product [Nippostrongylus brasiliensis]
MVVHHFSKMLVLGEDLMAATIGVDTFLYLLAIVCLLCAIPPKADGEEDGGAPVAITCIDVEKIQRN